MRETHKVLFCAYLFFSLFNPQNPLARSSFTMIFLLTPTLIISKCNFEHFGYSYQLSGSWKVLGTSQLAEVSTSPASPVSFWINEIVCITTTQHSLPGTFASPDCGCWEKGKVSLFSLLPFWDKNEEDFSPCHSFSMKNKGIFMGQKVTFPVALASFYLLRCHGNFLKKLNFPLALLWKATGSSCQRNCKYPQILSFSKANICRAWSQVMELSHPFGRVPVG